MLVRLHKCIARLSAIVEFPLIGITVNLYSAFCKQKYPKRAACASLVKREEKGFEVAPKR